MFSKYFPIGGLFSLWSRGFINFQRKIKKQFLSNSKAENICEDKKRKLSVPV